jgi:hypothetical protein
MCTAFMHATLLCLEMMNLVAVVSGKRYYYPIKHQQQL